jgi:DNA-binding Xre family transcriptional regulator
MIPNYALEIFYTKLKRLMAEKKVSARQLAEKCGVTERRIQMLKDWQPSLEILLDISLCLDCDPDYLWPEFHNELPRRKRPSLRDEAERY